MDHPVVTTDWSSHQSRFEFAPPRHFLLPAILLLVSEKPGYGYNLVKELQELRFGQVERPGVYRALAQLEGDGLVEAWSEAPKAGQARRVYGITEHGARMLRAWMGVVKDERDCLDRVLRRYQATGTPDAALAEVEGGWATALGHAWSPVSSTCATGRRRQVAETGSTNRTEAARPAAGAVAKRSNGSNGANGANGSAGPGNASAGPGNASAGPGNASAGVMEPLKVSAIETAAAVQSHTLASELRSVPVPSTKLCRFRVVPDRSVILIEARSTVGPIRFGAIGLTGSVEAEVGDGVVDTDRQPTGHLSIAIDELRSGNSLYDAELLRRIDARRFPRVTLNLCECTPIGSGDRYRLGAEVTFHGVTRPLRGTVGVSMLSDRKLVVTGEQAFDIRDFEIASPTVLMLRIYPDVRVNLHIEAELED